MHINLDLGIAVSETMGTSTLEPIANDYHKINAILGSMVDEVKGKIGRVSPLFYILEWVAKGKEDAIASFSIEIARDEAWRFAQRYHIATDKSACLLERDLSIAGFAQKIGAVKSWWLQKALRLVRWFERKDMGVVASVLEASA